MITVKGELIGDRILKTDDGIYSVFHHSEIPRYSRGYFLLEKVGYVYAILQYVLLDEDESQQDIRD